VAGKTTRAIAAKMGAREKTIWSYRYAIYKRLGVHSITGLYGLALRRGWV
jgi:DNA-binding CsgD family transcriptional regulator